MENFGWNLVETPLDNGTVYEHEFWGRLRIARNFMDTGYEPKRWAHLAVYSDNNFQSPAEIFEFVENRRNAVNQLAGLLEKARSHAAKPIELLRVKELVSFDETEVCDHYIAKKSGFRGSSTTILVVTDCGISDSAAAAVEKSVSFVVDFWRTVDVVTKGSSRWLRLDIEINENGNIVVFVGSDSDYKSFIIKNQSDFDGIKIGFEAGQMLIK